MPFFTAFGLVPEASYSYHTMTLLLQKVLINATQMPPKCSQKPLKYSENHPERTLNVPEIHIRFLTVPGSSVVKNRLDWPIMRLPSLFL